MTKQEYLAASLHHQIWCKILDYKSDYVGRPFDLIIGMNQWSKDGKLWSLRTLWGANPSFDRVLPICRPLSDLTKPIEHKGEKFVPTERLKTRSIPIKINNLNCISLDDIYSSYTETTLNDWLTAISYLLEWHFDIADLISKDEAIDVNTLEINPYK